MSALFVVDKTRQDRTWTLKKKKRIIFFLQLFVWSVRLNKNNTFLSLIDVQIDVTCGESKNPR